MNIVFTAGPPGSDAATADQNRPSMAPSTRSA